MSERLHERNGVKAGFVSFNGDGQQVDGYLAVPADVKPHPGVVLIQEWWGIEPHIKDLTERLSREGFVVLAPDLYHGEVASEPDQAQKAMMALNKDQALEEINRAIDYLQGLSEVEPKKIGATGFCMGGLLTWRTAEKHSDKLAAIAPFYGGYYEPTPEGIRGINVPVLAVWGSEDGSIPAEQRNRTVQLLKEAGKTFEAKVYPAGHAFMNDRHASYEPESARKAFAELVSWFKRHLGT